MILSPLHHLFEKSSTQNYKKGQVILHGWDEANYIYYIASGYIKMYNIADDGVEKIFMIFQPGTIFPVLPNRQSGPHMTNFFYQAMADVKLNLISRDQFIKLLEEDIEASRLMLNHMTQVAEDLTGRLSIIENKDARHKVINLLGYLCRVCAKEIGPGTYELTLRIRQQDMAALAGITRETASIQLKTLEHEGIIAKKRDKLVINMGAVPETGV